MFRGKSDLHPLALHSAIRVVGSLEATRMRETAGTLLGSALITPEQPISEPRLARRLPAWGRQRGCAASHAEEPSLVLCMDGQLRE